MAGAVELVITDVAYGGWGVGRWEGMAVFVPHTVTGDRVRVELVKQRHNYLQGSLQEIKEPSPWRVMPPCPHYGLCGGCQWEEIAYPYQLTIKEHQVVELFRRIGQQDPVPIGEAIPSPHRGTIGGRWNFMRLNEAKGVSLASKQKRVTKS